MRTETGVVMTVRIRHRKLTQSESIILEMKEKSGLIVKNRMI